jgi:hypothetical protein
MVDILFFSLFFFFPFFVLFLFQQRFAVTLVVRRFRIVKCDSPSGMKEKERTDEKNFFFQKIGLYLMGGGEEKNKSPTPTSITGVVNTHTHKRERERKESPKFEAHLRT